MRFPILDSVGEEEQRELLASTRRRRFARREVLFHEGDPGDTLHLIDRGRVAVRITTQAGDPATLDVLGRGDVVGIFAVLEEGGRRSATVVALEPTETLSLTRSQFLTLRHDHPSVDRFVIDVLAATVMRADILLIEALHSRVERRLLRRLLTLSSVYGTDGDGTIPLAQGDLASLAGTSRATANRILRDLEVAGVVTLSRNRIRVIDTDVLATRAR